MKTDFELHRKRVEAVQTKAKELGSMGRALKQLGVLSSQYYRSRNIMKTANNKAGRPRKLLKMPPTEMAPFFAVPSIQFTPKTKIALLLGDAKTILEVLNASSIL